jgi:beta-glucanase (GH16 family)
MKKLTIVIIGLWAFTLAAPDAFAQAKRKLIWSDEFNYKGLPDSGKWNYDVGGHGWGNEEKQYYTFKELSNARVENGLLIIEAKKEKKGENNYTSARLVTKGKGDWTYGRIDVKAKLPKGIGCRSNGPMTENWILWSMLVMTRE